MCATIQVGTKTGSLSGRNVVYGPTLDELAEFITRDRPLLYSISLSTTEQSRGRCEDHVFLRTISIQPSPEAGQILLQVVEETESDVEPATIQYDPIRRRGEIR